MRNTVIALIVGIVVGAGGARLYAPAPASEPAPEVELAPEAAAVLPDLPEPYYKVLFENDAVRVVEHLLEPGQTEPEHTHPPMVGYFVEGATAVITEADGSTAEVTLPTGAFVENLVWWTHSLENTGDTPLHSILVEFKQEAVGS
jgi:quercetin dioxygenase-like cupin family protein